MLNYISIYIKSGERKNKTCGAIRDDPNIRVANPT
jgi:hypothetical protein